MDQATADGELSKLTAALETLYDTPVVLTQLRRLVVTYEVTGKSVHDTHLVATMIAHEVKLILTFNTQDFSRFSMITILNPTTVAYATTPLIL